MTISSETCSISYPGDGISTTFTFPFLIPANSNGTPAGIVVVVDGSGNTSVVNPTSYSLTGVGSPSGGTVVYPLLGSPLGSSSRLVILRDVMYNQLTAVSNQAFYPHTLEQMGDYVTMMCQQLEEKAGRSIQAPPGEVLTLYLPSASHRAGLFLSFDGGGNPIAVAGTGGGGGTAWASITGVPPIISAFSSLTPSSGMIVEYTGAGSAHLIPTPSGGGGGGVTSVNGRTGVVTLSVADVNAMPAFGNSVVASLAAGANVTFTTVAGVTTIAATGGGGSGNMQPRLLSDYHAIDGGGVNTAANDLAFAAAEAAGDTAVYIPDGVFATTLAENTFTKHYLGRGTILFPGSANDKLPATYTYLAAKQPGAGLIGRTGWFYGSKFVVQEYKVIGPNVRTFDLAAVYFDATTIPRNSWMDVHSGSSGAQAFLTSGAVAGAQTITLPAAADASWVGKTVAFANSYGGSSLEIAVVDAVNTAGNNIHITTPLVNTYTWNPAAGFAPSIFFAPRTWAGEKYLKLTVDGGGDAYGHIVRTIANYVPKATEIHPFQAGTYGQYGGDVNAGSDGNYLQSYESQIQGNGHDISAIGFVMSYVRDVDIQNSGRFWAHQWAQSTGSRPVDVAYGAVGAWRNVIDTAFATVFETAILKTNAGPGVNKFYITASAQNGIHSGDPVIIGSETLTIDNDVGSDGGGLFFTTTVNCVGTYTSGQFINFSRGGAAVNLAKNHRIIFDSTVGQRRGSDPLTVFSNFYGNQQGTIIMEGGTDVSSDFWSVRFARGHTNAQPDTSRIRLRPTGVQIYGTGAHTVNGTSFSLTSSTSFNMDLSTGASLATWGPGIFFRVSGGNLQLTLDGGGSFHNL